MAKISLTELRTRASTVDRAKLDATTDADIEAYRAEDGYADLAVPDTASTVESPRALRVRLGMTQPEMAAALSVPLGTWRNWEQGRVNLEPAAAALLRVVSHSPEVALTALAAGGVTRDHPSIATEVSEARDQREAALADLIGISPISTVSKGDAASRGVTAATGAIPPSPTRHG